MKRYHLLGWLNAGFLILGSFFQAAAAEEAVASSQAQVQVQASVGARLAFGVDEILKLSRAQVSEDVIATYIQTSGTIFNLRPNDILQLHSQGVSDRIINLMLTQGRVSAEPTNQVAPMMPVLPVPVAVPVPATQAPAEEPLFIPGSNAAEIAAAYNPIVDEAPSTLYVIPNSGSFGYRSTYTVFGSCFGTCGFAPTYTVRLGGHHFHSFRRR